MKQLNVGQIRFEIRKNSGTKVWRVYDFADGCYPYQTPELGKVVQDVTEAEAQAEADRLNELFVREAPLIKETKKRNMDKREAPKPKPKTKPNMFFDEGEEEAPVFEPVPEKPLADYGVMSEEERAKYEDGLLEKVAY